MAPIDKIETLEDCLRARLADPRAALAAVTTDAGRLCLTFGDIGAHRRINLRVVGNDVFDPTRPEGAADAAASTKRQKRGSTRTG